MSAAHHVEAVVIGAGVIGLAVARALAKKGKEVLILERASTIGSETSSRNSEVIHAGIYYPENSLKARFCVEGKKMLYDFCEARNVPVNRCGKLVVATQESQWKETLPRLRDHAMKSGVDDITLLSAEDVKVLESEVQCVGALFSPSTGVLDSHAFMLSLLGDAENNNATLALSCGELDHGGFDKSQQKGGGAIRLCIDGMDLQCDTVVNCAGLYADQVAANIHANDDNWKPPKQYFAKGNYFRLEGVKTPFSRLVYPVPEPGGLGVHATIDWSGLTTKFGPDVEWVPPSQSPGQVSLVPDIARADAFYGEVRKYWPNLPDDSMVPDYAGLRPKLHHPSVEGEGSSAFVDFKIVSSEQHGVPGLVHLLGIESPGLTSSMAIADYVADRL